MNGRTVSFTLIGPLFNPLEKKNCDSRNNELSNGWYKKKWYSKVWGCWGVQGRKNLVQKHVNYDELQKGLGLNKRMDVKDV